MNMTSREALLNRTNAELMRVKQGRRNDRMWFIGVTTALAVFYGVAAAFAERNDSSNAGNGEPSGGGYHNGADRSQPYSNNGYLSPYGGGNGATRPQPYSYNGYLSPYGGISEPGCHVCSSGGQSGYASQASRNGF
jgi:hypothetical protein